MSLHILRVIKHKVKLKESRKECNHIWKNFLMTAAFNIILIGDFCVIFNNIQLQGYIVKYYCAGVMVFQCILQFLYWLMTYIKVGL